MRALGFGGFGVWRFGGFGVWGVLWVWGFWGFGGLGVGTHNQWMKRFNHALCCRALRWKNRSAASRPKVATASGFGLQGLCDEGLQWGFVKVVRVLGSSGAISGMD